MMRLTVSIFLKMIDHHSWQMYSDIECKHCGKNQFYGSYISNNNSCVMCKQTQETPILIIDNFPIVFERNEIVERLSAKIESILVLANLLDYEDIKYQRNYNLGYIKMIFKSEIKNKAIHFRINTDSKARYYSTSLYARNYTKLDNLDIYEALKEVERIM